MNHTVLLAVLILGAAGACSSSRPTQAMNQDLRVETCMQTTTLVYSDGVMHLSLDDARSIKTAVDEYLAAEKPQMDERILRPGEPFIDCHGTIRLGAWILNRSTSGPDLSLAYLIEMNEIVRVQQEIRVERVAGRWKAVSNGQVIHHLRRRP